MAGKGLPPQERTQRILEFFLGYGPVAGKTCAILSEAIRQRSLETHGRKGIKSPNQSRAVDVHNVTQENDWRDRTSLLRSILCDTL